MKIESLIAIRDRLKSYAPLLDYFVTTYPDKPVKFVIGSNINPSPIDYPFIGISGVRESKSAPPDLTRNQTVTVLFGVYEEVIENEIMRGVERLCDISELVLLAMEKQHLSAQPCVVSNGNMETEILNNNTPDFPYFQGKVTVTLTIR